MPRRDKKGPEGKGMMTGRHLGDCAGEQNIELKAVESKAVELKMGIKTVPALKVTFTSPISKIPGQGQFQGPRSGYGPGRGGGPGTSPGAGKGFGRGARRSSAK